MEEEKDNEEGIDQIKVAFNGYQNFEGDNYKK